MPGPTKVLIEMAFSKYEELPKDKQARVSFLAEDMAKEKGYSNLKEVMALRPYIYKQLIADAMQKLGFF